jgi:hypothetical protein
MAQLRFTLSFHGGKADKHRVSADTLAKIFRGLTDDIENVCRVISSEDVNIDIQEILRSCKLYVVAEPKRSSLALAVATEESETAWPETAGRVLATSLNRLSLDDADDDLPKGLTRSVLEHAKEYSSPPVGEYERMKLTIEANGKPEVAVVFDQELKVAAERRLVELTSPKASVIYGYSVMGVLYSLQDQDYDNLSAKVDVEVDPGDGTHWLCHVKRSDLPEDIDEIWRKRVVVYGKATFRQRKHIMDVERIEILGEKPDFERALENFLAVNEETWQGEDLSAYMHLVRERD